MLEELYERNENLLVISQDNQLQNGVKCNNNRNSQVNENADKNSILDTSSNPTLHSQPSEIISKSTIKSLKAKLDNLYLK